MRFLDLFRRAKPAPLDMRTLVMTAYASWKANNGQRMGASLAYYTVFSLAPLLLIVIAVAGLVYGHGPARLMVLDTARRSVGPDSAAAIGGLLEEIAKPAKGTLASVIGLGALLLGAMGVVGELQSSLNFIWKTPSRPASFSGYFRTRLASLSFILAIGFLLLVSLVLNALAAGVGKYMAGLLPVPEPLLQALNMGVSFSVITMMFALIYKLLPEARIAWRDVWTGAMATSLMFTLGNLMLGLYIGKAGVASVYGAAGSLIAIMTWTFYCSQILFFGAELTHAYSEARLKGVAPY
jgi:membrane protein